MSTSRNPAAAPLDFRWLPVGKQLKVSLRVLAGEDVLEDDTIDLGKRKDRTALAARVAAAAEVAVEDVEAELLRIAEERRAALEPRALRFDGLGGGECARVF